MDKRLSINKSKPKDSVVFRSSVLTKRSEDLMKVKKKMNFWKKIRRIFLVLLFSVFLLSCIGVFVALYFVMEFTKNLPDITNPAFMNPTNTENSIMYDRNGKELYRFVGDTNRTLIDKPEDIPEIVKYSFIMSEDAEYYHHKGIDLVALARCGIGAITGNVSCGGSTITQQAIKNSVLLNETYDLGSDQKQRKIRELLLALKLDSSYTKDQILMFYMNLVPQGGNVVGVRTAAKQYFGKELDQLTVEEAAMLAGIVQNPNKYSPYSTGDDVYCLNNGTQISKSDIVFQKDADGVDIEDKGPFKDVNGDDVQKVRPYKCRQLYVLEQFSEKLSIVNEKSQVATLDQVNAAKTAELKILPKLEVIKAPQFVFYARDQLTDPNAKFISDKPFTLDDIYNKGYRIYTTLDLDLQETAEKIIKDWVDGSPDWCSDNSYNCTLQKKGIKNRFGLYNSALGAIDSKTGEILTMVGSKDYFQKDDEGTDPVTHLSKFTPQVNIMTSLQQPGSSIKPIGLLAGFETGKINPSSVFPDMQIDINGYKPQDAENWTSKGQYFTNGPVSEKNFLTNSLRLSLNIPMILAADVIGVNPILDQFEKMGYTTFTDDRSKYGLAVMIGAGEVKPIEHINAYATIANGGVDHKVSDSILRIEDKNGNVLWKRDADKIGVQVVDPRATYLMTQILYKYSELHVGWNQTVSQWPNAGKTGTTDDNKDMWYMSYTPDLAVGMWVGNNDNSVPIRENGQLAYGYNSAQPALEKFLEKILPRYPQDEFQEPPGIVTAKVCKVSGLLATEKCGKDVVDGKFIQGKLPPVDDTYVTASVCYDKPVTDPSAVSKNEIARPIDEQYGYAKTSNYRYLKALNPARQEMYDKLIGQKPLSSSTQCTNDYTTVPGSPNIVVDSPLNNAVYYPGDRLSISVNATGVLGNITDIKAFLDGTLIASSNGAYLAQDYYIPASTSKGSHMISITAVDLGGKSATTNINITVGVLTATSSSTSTPSPQTSEGTVALSASANKISSGAVDIMSAKFSEGGIGGSMRLEVQYPSTTSFVNLGNMVPSGIGSFTSSWVAPTTKGVYTFKATYTKSGGSTVVSNTYTITVN